MRLGVLFFDNVAGEPSLDAVLTPLRAADVDVVVAEAAIVTNAEAIREAQRLSRADCDGVLLMFGLNADPALAADAALQLHCPLLLAESDSPVSLDAAGALSEVGISFDRGFEIDTAVLTWLTENSKRERQRGGEAARALSGQRLAVVGVGNPGLDASQWRLQFGITVSRVAALPEEGAFDFSAPDGDAYGALTARLLSLLTDNGPVYEMTVDDELNGGLLPDRIGKSTAARITRHKGSFRCVILLQDVLYYDGILGFRPELAKFSSALFSRRLHGVPGNHIGALRAACGALDIEPVILQMPPE